MSWEQDAAARVAIALCGMGRAGQIHFKGIRQNHRCRLKYVIEDDTDKARRMLSTYNMSHVRVLSGKDLHVALDDPELQAVLVATPVFTHYQIVTEALRAGKAVFCEKPVSDTAEKMAQCYDEAERKGLPLYCAFNRRFDPSIMRIKSKLDDGAIGKVHIIKTTSRDSPLPPIEFLKTSGGFMLDFAVHDLDTVCWLLNEDPVTVTTTAHGHNEEIVSIGDVDTVVIVMKFPSGAISIIDLSPHSCYGHDQRAEVYGSAGMLQMANQPVDSVVTSQDLEAVKHSTIQYSFPQRYDLSYQLELDHFLDVVVNPKMKLRVTRHDALRNLQLAQLCDNSRKTGQTLTFKYNDCKS